MKKSKIDPVLFERIIQKIEKYAKVSKENKDIVEKWIIIAENDFKVAKILYRKKYYSFSVYHLQQAFEKLTKSYYIFTGRLDLKEAVGHDFILKRLQKEIINQDMQDIIKLSSSMNERELTLNEPENSLKIINSSEDEIRNLNDKEIRAILEFINRLENKIKSKESIESIEKKIREKGFFNILKSLILKITHFRVRNYQIRKIIEEQTLLDYLNDILISIKLHYLSLITFLHCNCPRYPSIKDSKLNFFSYNGELGIVTCSPALFDAFEDILSNLKNWITKQTPKKQEGVKE